MARHEASTRPTGCPLVHLLILLLPNHIILGLSQSKLLDRPLPFNLLATRLSIKRSLCENGSSWPGSDARKRKLEKKLSVESAFKRN
jgi:hypothetical protein